MKEVLQPLLVTTLVMTHVACSILSAPDEETEVKRVAREFVTTLYGVDSYGAVDGLTKAVNSGKLDGEVADVMRDQLTRSQVAIEQMSIAEHTDQGSTVRVRGKVEVFSSRNGQESLTETRPFDVQLKIQARENPHSEESRLEVTDVVEMQSRDNKPRKTGKSKHENEFVR
jgi:hypothetical protein